MKGQKYQLGDVLNGTAGLYTRNVQNKGDSVWDLPLLQTAIHHDVNSDS